MMKEIRYARGKYKVTEERTCFLVWEDDKVVESFPRLMDGEPRTPERHAEMISLPIDCARDLFDAQDPFKGKKSIPSSPKP